MDVIEIIKDALVFPTKDIKILIIYILLSLLAGVLFAGGALVYVLGFIEPQCFLFGGLACVAAMIIGWIMLGYLISVVKSGIEHDDKVPEFVWWDNFFTGFNNFLVSIVYFIIPAFIVVVVGYITNVYGNMTVVFREISLMASKAYLGNSTTIAFDAISQPLFNLAISLTVTAVVAFVVFVIFSFLQYMAEARLANTDSISEALNVFEAAKDIARIGAGKVITLVVLIFVVGVVIEMVFSALCSVIPLLSILSIVISSYMILFAQRAIGLLYSDIA